MITVKQLSEQEIQDLAIREWPIWEKGVSEFPWEYGVTESCYILKGKAVVTPEGNDPVEIKAGDYVEFSAGMSCRWTILENIEKHYKFD